MEDIAQTLVEAKEKIVAKEFEAALKLLDDSPAEIEKSTEALYLQAVCNRYLNQFDRALSCLEKLKSLSPDHGRAHQEEGHTYRTMGKFGHALRAYERANFYNSALESSFRSQIDILRKTNQTHRIEQVQNQLDYLLKLPKPLVAVTDLISQGKLLKAENLCRQFMTQVPNHVEGMRLLAEIGIRLGVLDDAEYLLETAVALEPENRQARIDYISALRKRQNYEEALTQSRELLKGAPKNHQFRSIFAIESMQTGDFDTAIQIFDEILNDLPDDPLTHTTKGHALKTIGRSDDAVRSYKMAIRSNRGHGEAYYALANLKTYRFDQNEMSLLAELVEDPNLSFMDRVYMSFSLGKAYEDGKDFPQSFKFYEKGNKLKKTQSRYSAEKMSEEFELQKSVCDRAFFSARNGVGNVSGAPIFIVGLPRAGSTLLEQILSSHSKVDGTLELPNILSLSQQLRRRTVNDETIGYPGVLKKLENEEFCRFGEKFIEDTQIHRQGSPYFIDKMPNNFRHIGLIKLILPNAKIIDARRNAMDCCFSGFKQLFAEGQEFSYDLSDLGQYYKDYVKLMTHWDEVLPNFVLRVNNEDVIDDLEGEVRRMLDFCGLDFEEECLHFYKNKRNVRTPSAEQVRQPVSKFGVARWKPYEEFLLPLKNSLGL